MVKLYVAGIGLRGEVGGGGLILKRKLSGGGGAEVRPE